MSRRTASQNISAATVAESENVTTTTTISEETSTMTDTATTTDETSTLTPAQRRAQDDAFLATISRDENGIADISGLLDAYMSGEVSKNAAEDFADAQLNLAFAHIAEMGPERLVAFNDVRKNLRTARRATQRASRTPEEYGDAILSRLRTLSVAAQLIVDRDDRVASDVPDDMRAAVAEYVGTVLNTSGQGAATDAETDAAVTLVSRSVLRASGAAGKLQAHLNSVSENVSVGAEMTFTQIAKLPSEAYPVAGRNGYYVSQGAVARAFSADAKTRIVGWQAIPAQGGRGEGARYVGGEHVDTGL